MSKSYEEIHAKKIVRQMLALDKEIHQATTERKNKILNEFTKLDEKLHEIGQFENFSIYHEEIKNEKTNNKNKKSS